MEELKISDIENELGKKLKSLKKNTNDSIHHLLCKSREDEGYNVKNKKGHIAIEESLHRAIHNLFHNCLPHEQFAILYMLCENVLSEETKQHFAEFNMDNFYREDLLNKKKKCL